MKRSDLEHIIRAAGTIADDEDIVVLGSQAVLGQFPDAPPELLRSMEAGVFPRNHPERNDLIDGSIGEGSPFAAQFGYFAHGIDETTAVLPKDWRDRLVLVCNGNTRMIRGWCLEVHDLAIAKHAAGRNKDVEFTAALARHRLVRRDLLEERLQVTDLEDELRRRIRARISRQFESQP